MFLQNEANMAVYYAGPNGVPMAQSAGVGSQYPHQPMMLYTHPGTQQAPVQLVTQPAGVPVVTNTCIPDTAAVNDTYGAAGGGVFFTNYPFSTPTCL